MYEVKKFNLPEKIPGLSQEQINLHLGLYKGYVDNTNLLNEKLKELEPFSYEFYEVNRRFGFEFNGMRLHEFYFEQLEEGYKQVPEKLNSNLSELGGFDNFKEYLSKLALSRGIGWTLLLRDRKTGTLSVRFVNDHEVGMVADSDILFALDMWEHAFMVDYAPATKKDYVENYLQAVNWEKVAERF